MTQRCIEIQRKKIRCKIRKKIIGTISRPRLVVTFSNLHIYAQCVDDNTGSTLMYLSSISRKLRNLKLKANLNSAKIMGKYFAKDAKKVGIKKVVFDRAGRSYHGAVKSFAEEARREGLIF